MTYPFAVDFDSLEIEMRREERTMTVKARRTQHIFTEQKPALYYFNPDNFLGKHRNRKWMLGEVRDTSGPLPSEEVFGVGRGRGWARTGGGGTSHPLRQLEVSDFDHNVVMNKLLRD